MASLPLASPIDLLASAVRRERERLGLSVSELAKRARIAKSTLSQLEAGSGNPSLETLWALATALGVQVTRLIAEPLADVHVVRANEGVALASEQANYAATLLAVCPAGMQRDLYRLAVQPGEPRASDSHLPGTVEHVVLCSGRARVGPAGRPVELAPGDYARYAADARHVFEALEPNTTAVLLIEHP
ncbi:helix-turn-helix domain protein [Paracidovorax avenae ATCC 19860]|uniref:Helix-turn-helix domain protein n=1 Tax=Paracidovorax avenae (strain ATCC 19860 / DSM 7227 / CCUG 15838 / JCM 20985 / LMG 2117 / NCPPB 1011) TaxID=643561 RepID=F0Q5G7_PARA1|nr:XRE family transcriptional regulator [Paracidovorax avenae]ADX45595.1 helix-turn-helix domain protein [Paracidovorax avenae ATCC 19860]